MIQYQEQGNLTFQLLVKSQLLKEPLDLNELMRYSLTPVPHSLGTPDGFMAKTNKASMLHHLLEDYSDEVHYPTEAFFIQDGNAMFHSLKDLPPTFEGICLKVLDQMVAKGNFIFSTDSYVQDSIKSQERLRRGVSEKFIIDGPATRKPADMKEFLLNGRNKEQLCDLLLRVWSSNEAVTRLQSCSTAIVIVQGKAFQIAAPDGDVVVSEIPELYSKQEETDTWVVLYLNHAARAGFKSAVVRTPDTDIFFVLLHYAHTIKLNIYVDCGVGKNRQLIDVSALALSLGKEYCEALLGIYVFTGEYCTSAFKGKGKIGPLRKLQAYPRFQKVFQELGTQWSMKLELYEKLETFTCLMYGYPRETSVNKVKTIMLQKMVGEDEKISLKSKVKLSRLPPCADSLAPHLDRVNHRVAVMKRSHIPVYLAPKPYDGQGWVKDGNKLEPLWSHGSILPPSLVDILDTSQSDDQATDEDEDIIDYDDMLDYIDEDNEWLKE